MSAAATVTSTDWPQYQHDENRTGFSPATNVPRSYPHKWSYQFTDDILDSSAQPIGVGDNIFIGTKKGFVYAFSISTTSPTNPQPKWSRQLDGPIIHTLATDGINVYAATLTGSVYALNYTTGTQTWVYKPTTKASFGSAVLLVPSKQAVYVADRYGKLHAINTADGKGKWTQPWSAPANVTLVQSPTYGDTTNDTVFIGAENMRLYGVNADTGIERWQSDKQFYGRSFFDYSPVFAEGKVIVNTAPVDHWYHINPYHQPTGSLVDDAYMDDRDDLSLPNAMAASARWIQDHPDVQNVYAVDAATGIQPFIPPIFRVVANGGAMPAPLYDSVNKILYTYFHVRHSHLPSGAIPYAAIGKLDLTTGTIVQRFTQEFGGPDEITVDETNNFSGAGDVWFGARCGNSPRCKVIGSTSACSVGQTTYYFVGDMCRPNPPPAYINGRIMYQVWNNLSVFGN